MFDYFIIVLTRGCNGNCSYCGIKKKDFSSFWDSLDDYSMIKVVKNIVKVVNNNNMVGIRFFGGEVFLKKDLLLKIIQLLRYNGFNKDIYVNTNLLLFKEEDIVWIKKYNVKIITSLNGVREIHCKTRNISEDAFNHLIDNVKSLVRENVYLQLNMVIFPFKYDIINNFLYVKGLSPNIINLIPLSYTSLGSLKDTFYRNISKLFLFLKKEKLQDILLPICSSKVNNLQKKIDQLFPLFIKDLLIDVDGAVYYNTIVLHDFFSDYKEHMKVGFILDDLTSTKINKKFILFPEEVLFKKFGKEYSFTKKIHKYICYLYKSIV